MSDQAEDPVSSDVLLVSTADWDNPYWTNKQHVAVELARLGKRILYVESQGLRRPTATSRDLLRIAKRLKRGLTPPREVRPGLWVWSPIVIPFQQSGIVRRLNRLLLRAGWRFWGWRLGLRPQTLWTYSPLTTELYDLGDFQTIVYHAVDAIDAQPGMPRDIILEAEKTLALNADIIFTTAPALKEKLAVHNRHTFFLSNVADFAHFSAARTLSPEPPADLTRIKSPRIGFVGAISAYKVDIMLLVRVAQSRPDWSFVLIGEVGEGEPLTDVQALHNVSNIHLVGGRPYDTLPSYLAHFDLAIIPAAHNSYTQSMFPMKFFEYLAAGLPVVSTSLPALKDYHHVAAFADTAEDFTQAIERILAGDAPSLSSRLEAAKDQTYERRTERMLKIIAEVAKGMPSSQGVGHILPRGSADRPSL